MKYIERRAERLLRRALADTPVVVISGPRQSGKSTLARHLADSSWDYLTLDDQNILNAARDDPNGLLARASQPIIIDEIQRVPELLRTVKMMVDKDRKPGQFLITGSANLLTIPSISESLAGRSEVIPLLPLSQSELHSTEPVFLSKAFRGEPAEPQGKATDEKALFSMVLRGGFPEVLARRNFQRAQDWCGAYLDALVQRDIRDISTIRKVSELPHLLNNLANHSGKLVNQQAIGRSTGLDAKTVSTYISAFEQLFLLSRVPAWHNNRLHRLTKSSKLHFTDTALLASLLEITPGALSRDRTLLGPLLETFVHSELRKLAAWHGSNIRISHYRDKDKTEVDFVLENARSQMVGIEVKAAATVHGKDFAGMRKIAAVAREQFLAGFVIYTGDQVLPFGEGLFAIPLSSLWAGE